MASLVGARVIQGGHHGIKPLTVLQLSLPLSQFRDSNLLLSVNIRPNRQILLPTTDTPHQSLPAPVSPTTVPNGTTHPKHRFNPQSRQTNNRTSQMGMVILNRWLPAGMRTIAMARPKSMAGVVRGKPSTMTTRTTILGLPDAYVTFLFCAPFSLIHDHAFYRMVYGGTLHEGLARNTAPPLSLMTTLSRKITS